MAWNGKFIAGIICLITGAIAIGSSMFAFIGPVAVGAVPSQIQCAEAGCVPGTSCVLPSQVLSYHLEKDTDYWANNLAGGTEACQRGESGCIETIAGWKRMVTVSQWSSVKMINVPNNLKKVILRYGAGHAYSPCPTCGLYSPEIDFRVGNSSKQIDSPQFSIDLLSGTSWGDCGAYATLNYSRTADVTDLFLPYKGKAVDISYIFKMTPTQAAWDQNVWEFASIPRLEFELDQTVCASACPSGQLQKSAPDCSCYSPTCTNTCGAYQGQKEYPDCSCYDLPNESQPAPCLSFLGLFSIGGCDETTPVLTNGTAYYNPAAPANPPDILTLISSSSQDTKWIRAVMGIIFLIVGLVLIRER